MSNLGFVKHVTFIVPPFLCNTINNLYHGRTGCPPLNIAFLAAINEQSEVDYDVVDALTTRKVQNFSAHCEYRLRGLSVEETVELVPEHSSVIAISAMFTSEWIVVRELLRQLKIKFPDKPIILGGEHASSDAYSIIKFEDNVDAIFNGESEKSYEEFLNLSTWNEIYELDGIIYRKNGEPQFNPKPKRILDLDKIKPSWKKIDVDYYLDNKLSYSELGNRTMPVISSRGCPYQCTFCTNSNMWGTRYVMRSVESIIDELDYYIKRYRAEHFDFIDLATSVNRKWFKELLERMIDELPPFSWEMTVGTRSEILDEEILDLLYRSGTRVLSYAPETGSEKFAKKIKKRIKHDKMYSSIRAAVKRGLFVKANVVIGFPNEGPAVLLSTIWMCLKLGAMGVKSVSIAIYQPYPGTELSADLYKESTYEEYDARVQRLTANESHSVFSLIDAFRNPRAQFYAFITNSIMILSYLLACLRRPSEFIKSFKNIKSRRPIGSVEVAIHGLLFGD